MITARQYTARQHAAQAGHRVPPAPGDRWPVPTLRHECAS